MQMPDMKSFIEAEKITKPSLRKRWIEALRSGRYKQGRNELKTTEGNYCCLGVLCEIAGVEWKERIINGAFGLSVRLVPNDEHLTRLNVPESIMRETGLSENHASSLARLNDYGEATFERIAALIEYGTIPDLIDVTSSFLQGSWQLKFKEPLVEPSMAA